MIEVRCLFIVFCGTIVLYVMQQYSIIAVMMFWSVRHVHVSYCAFETHIRDRNIWLLINATNK